MVDEGSLRVGANRTVLRSAQSLFERLAPGDMVGLARLPNGTGGVEFTVDRKRITDALMKITGAPNMRTGMAQVNISEAWALESNDESTFQNAVSRECSGMSGPDLEACRNALEADARAMLLEASSRARATLQSLEALLKNLIQLEDARQHRDDLGGHVRGARSPEHDRHSAASRRKRAPRSTSSGRRRIFSTSRSARRAARRGSLTTG